MMDPEKIMYSINSEDIQNVARQATDRTLTEEELKFVAEKLGDYVGRCEAIVQAIGELKGTP
ncbi:MAG: hypothetical protein AYP45_03985 [Candidatus Brocadia carolinensis]|uniref:Uncharacterized protein n=1 Tax=Candidatus Brocadia carolinensis TaxID=1004156 RepID=A0A1V4AW16_9BACT|nr:MAG: hypothetical protein AYP45_03985 [Candidatus Brocadia caroliniensis]